MAKIIALDCGFKRTGIAVTDDLQIISSPLITLETEKLIIFLDDYIKKNSVEIIVIGEPKKLNLESTDSTLLVKNISNVVKNKFPKLKIVMIDERYTSKIAKDYIINFGYSKKKRRDKSLVDEISASIILQSYLDQIKWAK